MFPSWGSIVSHLQLGHFTGSSIHFGSKPSLGVVFVHCLGLACSRGKRRRRTVPATEYVMSQWRQGSNKGWTTRTGPRRSSTGGKPNQQPSTNRQPGDSIPTNPELKAWEAAGNPHASYPMGQWQCNLADCPSSGVTTRRIPNWKCQLKCFRCGEPKQKCMNPPRSLTAPWALQWDADRKAARFKPPPPPFRHAPQRTSSKGPSTLPPLPFRPRPQRRNPATSCSRPP